MWDLRLQNFLKAVLQLAGFDTSQNQEELLRCLEQSLVAKSMQRFLKTFSGEERAQYENFLREHPQASGDEVADFFKRLRPNYAFENLFNEEAEQLLGQYLKQLLTLMNGSQKQEVQQQFFKLLKDFGLPPEALQKNPPVS